MAGLFSQGAPEADLDFFPASISASGCRFSLPFGGKVLP
jgi:hypothetical protein